MMETFYVDLGISFEDFQLQDQDQDHSLDLQGYDNHQFAIFVSFAEIYNEFVYDLLLPTPAKGKHRPTLRICQDKYQNNYIKGITGSSCNSGLLVLCDVQDCTRWRCQV